MSMDREDWIVVSGANGLLGKSVCRQLVEQGNKVLGLIRPSDTRRPVDGITYQGVDLAAPFADQLDVPGPVRSVVHLAQAAGWHAFPEHTGQIARINLGATIELAQWAIRAKAKSFVYASSGGIYGAHETAITEDSPRKPAADLGFYLDTKYQAEHLLDFFRAHVAIHIMRPFFIYGSEQADSFLIIRLMESVFNGTAIKAANGTGPRLNPIHALDAARAICAAIRQETAFTCNIAGPEPVYVAEIAQMIGDLLGKPVNFETAGTLNGSFVADITRMTKILGAPELSMREGLSDVLAARYPITQNRLLRGPQGS